jgi:hypothetical protein
VIKSEDSKISAKSIFGLSIASLFLFVSAGVVGLSNKVVNEQLLSLSPNETTKLTDSRSGFSQKTKEFVFEVPAETPNSKVLEIGNSKESLSVFKVGNRANLVFTGQGKNGKKFFSDPLDVPMDFDGQSYSVSMLLEEPSGVVSLKTSDLIYNWKVPSDHGFSVTEYFKSGSITEFRVQLTIVSSLNKPSLFLFLFSLGCTLILFTLRKPIYNFFSYKSSTDSIGILQNKRIHYVLLVFGIASLVLLPPAPPSGLLSSGSIDLSKVTDSDLILQNKEFSGGWLFKNSPDVNFNPEDYSSTFKYDIEVLLNSDETKTYLFAYGIPYGEKTAPKSKRNYEVEIDSTQRVFFHLPTKVSQSIFVSRETSKGIHRISGEIRSGRELEVSVDDKLVFANSSQVPYMLLQDPNLFISEYLLENLQKGSVSWEVKAEAESPIGYALYRLQAFVTFVLLFVSVMLICLRILRSKDREKQSNAESLKVLRFSYLTFMALSVIGALIWVMKLQPVSSMVSTTRNNPLFLPEFRFSDFYQLFISAQSQDPFSNAGVVYPPFVMLIFDLTGFFSARQGLILFLGMTLAGITALFANAMLSRKDFSFLDKTGVLAATCLSFPIVFAVDRGNLDILIAVLLVSAVWLNSKTSNRYASGIVIGLAAAIKVYPVFLLPIFYYQKRDKRVIVAFLVTFTLLSATGVLRYNMELIDFVKTVILGSSGQELSLDSALRWNGSLAAFVTTAVVLVAPDYAVETWTILSGLNSVITLLSIAGILGLLLAKKKIDVTMFSIAWLSLISLAFPLTAAYKFTMFLIAFYYLIIVGVQPRRRLREIGVLLGVVVSPVIFWYFGSSQINTFSFIVPLATITLIFLIWRGTTKMKKHKLSPKVTSLL